MQILQAVNLTKRYDDFTAVNQLSLTLNAGDIFCLLGQNGAGKTTTINLFLGFITASSGQAVIKGVTVSKGNAATNKFLAYIPEVVQLYGNLDGIENLDYFSRLAGFKYSKDVLINFLKKAGLPEEVQLRRLATYSKGMRQKVGIAIALAKHADLILMDEPTSGLDPKATAEFTDICKELAAEGRTIFMATHDIFNAVNLGTRIGIMKRGSLIHTAETSNITANELQQLYLETI